jgi:hypothetical protein
MKQMKWLTILLMIMISALVISGCAFPGTGNGNNAENLAQTYVAQTDAAQEDGEGADPATDVSQAPTDPPPTPTEAPPSPTPSATRSPTDTVVPTETMTPTPQTPKVHVETDTNCRTGPSDTYPYVGGLLVDEEAEVVGRYPGGDYWIVNNPDGTGECWLWGFYATVTGPTDDLPVYTQPPTPTPVIDWSGTWTTFYGNPGGLLDTYIVTLNQNNNKVTGSFMTGSVTVNLSGTLSNDDQTLTGTYDDGSVTGSFVWEMINRDQFVGNSDSGSYAWCGYRNGAGRPSPCLGP